MNNTRKCQILFSAMYDVKLEILSEWYEVEYIEDVSQRSGTLFSR